MAAAAEASVDVLLEPSRPSRGLRAYGPTTTEGVEVTEGAEAAEWAEQGGLRPTLADSAAAPGRARPGRGRGLDCLVLVLVSAPRAWNRGQGDGPVYRTASEAVSICLAVAAVAPLRPSSESPLPTRAPRHAALPRPAPPPTQTN